MKISDERKQKGLSLLKKEVERLRKLSYQELEEKIDKGEEVRDYGDTSDMENFYQTEVQVFYDDKKSKDIRVIVSVIIGNAKIFQPKELMDDFILSPEGKFIDE